MLDNDPHLRAEALEARQHIDGMAEPDGPDAYDIAYENAPAWLRRQEDEARLAPYTGTCWFCERRCSSSVADAGYRPGGGCLGLGGKDGTPKGPMHALCREEHRSGRTHALRRGAEAAWVDAMARLVWGEPEVRVEDRAEEGTGTYLVSLWREREEPLAPEDVEPPDSMGRGGDDAEFTCVVSLLVRYDVHAADAAATLSARLKPLVQAQRATASQ